MEESKREVLMEETCAAGKAPRPGLSDERGVGVVEVILILVILIALVLIFKTQMTSLVNTIFNTITSSVNSVLQ